MKPKYKIGQKVKLLVEQRWMDVSIGGGAGVILSASMEIKKGFIGTVTRIREKKDSLWQLILKQGNTFNSTKFSYYVIFQDEFSVERELQENQIRKIK